MDMEDAIRAEIAEKHPAVRNDTTVKPFIEAYKERQLHLDLPWPQDSIFAKKTNTPQWW